MTWAGITAGKAQSFFSFTGGGDNWANFASPDQKGFNEPDLLAYTASFGGGFSATIAAQSPGRRRLRRRHGSGRPAFRQHRRNSGTATHITYGGQKWPDFVGALHVKQGWGEAQVSGVIHNVNVRTTGITPYNAAIGAICGLTGAATATISTTRSVGRRRWREDQPAVVRRGGQRPRHRRLRPERGLVLGSAPT